MIGLSLSLCIEDILAQKVALSQVEYLIVGTCYRSEEELAQLINGYRKYYSIWREYSWAEIRELINSIKIVQPRLENDRHFPNIALGYWVESAAEILWEDDLNLPEKQQERLSNLKVLRSQNH